MCKCSQRRERKIHLSLASQVKWLPCLNELFNTLALSQVQGQLCSVSQCETPREKYLSEWFLILNITEIICEETIQIKASVHRVSSSKSSKTKRDV